MYFTAQEHFKLHSISILKDAGKNYFEFCQGASLKKSPCNYLLPCFDFRRHS